MVRDGSTPPGSDGEGTGVDVDAADRVARLADLILTGQLGSDEAAALRCGLQELLARHAPAEPADHDRQVEALAQVPYRFRSPFVGTANVRAPGMVLERVQPEESEEPALRGRVILNPCFSGPAGLAHGGIIIGLFDELFGSLATVVGADGAGVTATLDARFRRPTPTGTELILEARLIRRSSRRLKMEATCTAGDTTTATAEALMVIAR